MNLIDLARNFIDEESAVSFLESKLWPDGPQCRKCGLVGEAYRIKSKPGSKNKVRPGLWKCKGCRKPFRVTMGTIFEDSHIPVHKWLMAMHLMAASKKGMSAHQFHRMLGVTYKSAWFMCHRIRWAVKRESFSAMLTGEVEADETYVGGKKIGQGVYAGKKAKAPVLSLVERHGEVRSFHVADVTAANLKPIIEEHVNLGARLNTDDSVVYPAAIPEGMRHDSVNHSAKEYSRIEPDTGRLITTNTVEGYFSILKRGVYGTFHHVSKHHLHRYLSEFDFRYNARDIDDGERCQAAIKSVVGKRLTYYRVRGGEGDSVVG
jgi:transposase-like protein